MAVPRSVTQETLDRLAAATLRHTPAQPYTVADRFENEHANFHERVRRGFLALAREDARRVRVMEATRSAGVIHEEILTTTVRQFQAEQP